MVDGARFMEGLLSQMTETTELSDPISTTTLRSTLTSRRFSPFYTVAQKRKMSYYKIPPFTRPLLSSIEKDILNEFIETIKKTKSQFCCGGTIEHPADRKLGLFYDVKHDGQARM